MQEVSLLNLRLFIKSFSRVVNKNVKFLINVEVVLFSPRGVKIFSNLFFANFEVLFDAMKFFYVMVLLSG